ncbi:MAG: ABC-2 family transporter protein [Anaerolineales bacterium]
MSANLGRRFSARLAAYAALAAMLPKTFLAYEWSTWLRILQNIVNTVVFVYFWRAMYSGTVTIGGLTLGATLTYILLARVFEPLADLDMLMEFGWRLSDGGIALQLVRPVDMQLAYFIQGLGGLALALARQVPTLLLATFVFGLRWPSDPAVWAVFIVSALLGRSVMFCLDWILGCLTFYTTEVWGLWVAVQALTLFLTGGLLPLNMMPDWLRVVVQSTPFAQSIYVPISLLSGLTPLAEAPRLLLGQAAWLLGMLVVSRLIFRVAVRSVTVQGG